MIGFEQTCLDCGNREAAGAYCTACRSRNVERHRTGSGRPRGVQGKMPRTPLKRGRGRPRKESVE